MLRRLPATSFVHPALLQERAGARMRCLTCERRCEIPPRGLGWCGTRCNQDGRLVTLIYGAVSSLSANPIEKKPFYHFLPGTRALTCGSWSCNFGCPWCQNYPLSKTRPAVAEGGLYISPSEYIAQTLRWDCQGTSISFNEPTLSLEWSLDVFRLAATRGLYNSFVTNGYMTAAALRLLADAGLDAMNVDVKGDAAVVWRYCRGIDVEKVWRNCQFARELGLHLEITTLVIPGVNDADEVLAGIARRIAHDLGVAVPWHVTAYTPAWRFTAAPTPVSTLEHAAQLGWQAGLEFVYVGNVPEHRLQHTYCPGCGRRLIERRGMAVVANWLENGHCPACGRAIAGVWSRPVGQPVSPSLGQ
jgi:pyruvate formate lyase activating enzyme